MTGTPSTMTTATYLENAAVKPDLVIWDKAEKRPLIIEVGIPHDSGLNRAESLTSHKISRPDARHEEKLEFEGDLNCSCYLWCNRPTEKTLRNHLMKIPGKPRAAEVQTIALKGTAIILKRTLGGSL